MVGLNRRYPFTSFKIPINPYVSLTKVQTKFRQKKLICENPRNLRQRIPKMHLPLSHPMHQRHEDLLLHPQELPHRFLHLGVLPPYPISRRRSKIRLAVWRCFFGRALSSSMI